MLNSWERFPEGMAEPHQKSFALGRDRSAVGLMLLGAPGGAVGAVGAAGAV